MKVPLAQGGLLHQVLNLSISCLLIFPNQDFMPNAFMEIKKWDSFIKEGRTGKKHSCFKWNDTTKTLCLIHSGPTVDI